MKDYLEIDSEKVYSVMELTRLLGFNIGADTVGKRLRGHEIPFHYKKIKGQPNKCYKGSDLIDFGKEYPILLRKKIAALCVEPLLQVKSGETPVSFDNGAGIDGSYHYTVKQLSTIVGITRKTMHLRLKYYNVSMDYSTNPLTIRGDDFMNAVSLYPCLVSSTQIDTQKPVETPNLSDKSEGFLSIMERVAKLKKIVKGLPIGKAKALIQSFSDGLKAKC